MNTASWDFVKSAVDPVNSHPYEHGIVIDDEAFIRT